MRGLADRITWIVVADGEKALVFTNDDTPEQPFLNIVSKEEIDQLLSAFISMNDNPETETLLRALNFKGFEAASNNDWDDVRALNIDVRDSKIAE